MLAKFNLVTIEKWHGACTGNVSNSDGEHHANAATCPDPTITSYACCEEDRMVADLRRIKAINPNTTTVLYFNLVLDFPQYRLHFELVADPTVWDSPLTMARSCA